MKATMFFPFTHDKHCQPSTEYCPEPDCLSILLIRPTMELEPCPTITEETGCNSGEPEIWSLNLSLK